MDLKERTKNWTHDDEGRVNLLGVTAVDVVLTETAVLMHVKYARTVPHYAAIKAGTEAPEGIQFAFSKLDAGQLARALRLAGVTEPAVN